VKSNDLLSRRKCSNLSKLGSSSNSASIMSAGSSTGVWSDMVRRTYAGIDLDARRICREHDAFPSAGFGRARRPRGGGRCPQTDGLDHTPYPHAGAVESWSSCTLSKSPRGVDVRFRSRSGGIAAQHLMSLLNVVALSD
jgi:hypothetical protein